MGNRLLLIGGGGHCHSVLDSVLAIKRYEEIGIIDNHNSTYLGVPVIGSDEDVPRLYKEGWTDAFITVGSIGDASNRRRLYEMVKSIGMSVPTIIDPSAIIGQCFNNGEGTYVGKNAIINTGSVVGTCAIINSGSIIEHDCIIGDFSHISSGAILCGQVSVGHDSHVGAGATVRQLIKIGDNSLIGVGSVVVNNISSNVKAYGNPCKVIE